MDLLLERLAAHSRSRADTVALVSQGRCCRWRELGEQSNQIACSLIERGFAPGSRLAILAGASIEYVEIFLGILQAGCSVVPLPSLMKAETLAHMLADSEAKAIFVSQSLKPLADNVLKEFPGISVSNRIAIDFSDDGWASLLPMVTAASGDKPALSVSADQEFNLIYSSGTTGTPKGIVHSHQVRASQMSAIDAVGIDSDSVTLVSTAMYANWTLFGLLAGLFGGGKVVLMSKFDVGVYLQLLKQEAVTHAFLVPAQITRLLEHPDFDAAVANTDTMKFCAGSPLSADYKREVMRRWPGGLVENYGLTEGSPTTLLFAHSYPDKLQSVGRAMEGSEIRIIDDAGTELPTGAVGEVVGRSGAMMSHYHNCPELTKKFVWRDRDGARFFRSGDIGRLDEDGFLYLMSRKKDVIISGGMNIYASDIEATFAAHDEVDEVAVIGVPSKQWGETPMALVVLQAGAARSADDLKSWANERLGKAQRVSAVELRHDLPRGTLGKILKRELRDPYWQ